MEIKLALLSGQFLKDVCWGVIDWLVIDSPPGTSDEHITLMQELRKSSARRGALVITTPQLISVADVRREITFCQKTGIPVYGVVENMSGFVCPHCKVSADVCNFFWEMHSSSSGRAMFTPNTLANKKSSLTQSIASHYNSP